MTVDLSVILEDCLERMAQGEALQICLKRYPEQAAELEPLLGAAARLEKGAQVRPSAGFKARSRRDLYTFMGSHPRRSGLSALRFSPGSRLALGLSVIACAFLMTTTALAQSALPGGILYAWKLTSEQVWRRVSPDPEGVDLALAGRRVDEAVAVSGDAGAQAIALDGYQKIIINLAQYKDPSDQPRIQAEIKTQQNKLQGAGIKIQGPVHTPPDAGTGKPAGTGKLPGGIATPAAPGLKSPDVLNP